MTKPRTVGEGTLAMAGVGRPILKNEHGNTLGRHSANGFCEEIVRLSEDPAPKTARRASGAAGATPLGGWHDPISSRAARENGPRDGFLLRVSLREETGPSARDPAQLAANGEHPSRDLLAEPPKPEGEKPSCDGLCAALPLPNWMIPGPKAELSVPGERKAVSPQADVSLRQDAWPARAVEDLSNRSIDDSGQLSLAPGRPPLAGRASSAVEGPTSGVAADGRTAHVADGHNSIERTEVKVLASRLETHLIPILRQGPAVQIAVALTAGLEAEGASAGGLIPSGLPRPPVSSAGAMRIVHVTLEPADLGTVRVQLTLRGESLELRLNAEHRRTAELIRREQDSLVRLLRSAGYEIEAVSVHAADPDLVPSYAASVSTHVSSPAPPTGQPAHNGVLVGNDGPRGGQPQHRHATPTGTGGREGLSDEQPDTAPQAASGVYV